MKTLRKIMISLGCVALAACSTNNTAVVVPQNNIAVAGGIGGTGGTSSTINPLKAAVVAAARPCLLPPDKRGAYAAAVATKSLTVEPPQAKLARVSGCASATFNLDKNGQATNIQILTEVPQGYGYADALMQMIQGSTYNPPVALSQIYFLYDARAYKNANSSQ